MPLEPALSSAEFHAAALIVPELAVYVIRVAEDGHLTFEEANDVVARIAGVPQSEIRGRPIGEILLPEVAQCLTTNIGTCVKTGEGMAYHRTFDLATGRASFKTSLSPIARGTRGVRYVLGVTRDMTQEVNQIETAEHHAALFRALGVALPSAVYLLDTERKSLRFVGGKGSGAQLEWRKGAEEAGPDGAHLFFHPDDWPRVKAHWAELAELPDGEVFTISYRLLALHGEYRRHINREIVLSRDGEGQVKLVLGVSEDVSEQDRIEQEVRDLSARMMTLQIDERRKIAQELHDSTGQHLTGAALALRNARNLMASAQAGNPDATLLAVIDDADQCLADAQREIRVLSYLMQPPSLQSQGLADSLRDFATGFGRRAGLKISIDVAPEASEIDDDTAVHLFRVCQEALTNVYRHAKAHKARVLLEVDDFIRLTVQDDGIGFDPAEPDILGLGLPGMRERMMRLGGSVSISGDPSGTTLIATVPVGQLGPAPKGRKRGRGGRIYEAAAAIARLGRRRSAAR